MNLKRISEFYEGENNRFSMPRLLAFMSFFPASSVLAVIHTETALMYYLAAYSMQFVGSKWMDAKMISAKNALRKPSGK